MRHARTMCSVFCCCVGVNALNHKCVLFVSMYIGSLHIFYSASIVQCTNVRRTAHLLFLLKVSIVSMEETAPPDPD